MIRLLRVILRPIYIQWDCDLRSSTQQSRRDINNLFFFSCKEQDWLNECILFRLKTLLSVGQHSKSSLYYLHLKQSPIELVSGIKSVQVFFLFVSICIVVADPNITGGVRIPLTGIDPPHFVSCPCQN